MAATWYFAKDGQRVGPFTAEQIRQMVTAGFLTSSDLLLKLGEQTWVRVHTVKGLLADAPPQALETPAETGLKKGRQAAEQNATFRYATMSSAAQRVDIESAPPLPTIATPAIALTMPVESPFPKSVATAGIIWIIVGTMVIVMNCFGMTANSGAEAEASILAAMLYAIFAAAFIFVGIQSIVGAARDTLGNGVGSLVFGSSAIYGSEQYSLGVGYVAFGIALFVAGVVALVGRSNYKKWRRAKDQVA